VNPVNPVNRYGDGVLIGGKAVQGRKVPGQWQVGDDDILPTDGRKAGRTKFRDRFGLSSES
ncbi:MAG: hypothetical protein ACRDZ8_09575, partial [Acidimicrobiales bacterium]